MRHSMDELIAKLKVQIIEELSLDDLSPDELQDDEPLFGEGLGLDSIDALSLVVVLDRDYGIQIDDPGQGKDILYSIKTIAQYITDNT
jgi:acyl carrier protein